MTSEVGEGRPVESPTPVPPESTDPAAPPNAPPPETAAGSARAKRRGLFGRVFEWFWGKAALAELVDSGRVPSARARDLIARARAALELGRTTLDPPRPFENGPVDAFACDLYAQSIYWTLLAHRHLRTRSVGANAVSEPSSLDELWLDADEELLVRAAEDRAVLEALGRAVRGKSFVDFAELSSDEQARLARSLRPFAEGLLSGLDSAQLAYERLWLRRVLRLSLVLSVIAAAVVAALFAMDRAEQARDIAREKPWTASSRWPEGGCVSPAQECEGSPNYFFATAEEDNPSIEFDLQRVQPVSGFRIRNRVDCCRDRAVPLVVEVSTDHKHWKQVARREDEFRTWADSFPTTQARWVRLRATRRTFLHLAGVRLFP